MDPIKDEGELPPLGPYYHGQCSTKIEQKDMKKPVSIVTYEEFYHLRLDINPNGTIDIFGPQKDNADDDVEVDDSEAAKAAEAKMSANQKHERQCQLFSASCTKLKGSVKWRDHLFLSRGTIFEKNPEVFSNCSILFQTNEKNQYTFMSSQFNTVSLKLDDAIVDFYNPLNRSDAMYPVIITDKYYYLVTANVRIKRDLFCGDVANLYPSFYSLELSEDPKALYFEKLK